MAKPAKTPKTAKPKAEKPAKSAAPQPVAPIETPAPAPIEAPAAKVEPARGPARVDGWLPVRKATTLVDGKLYTAFARGRQIDVQHRGGEFFTDNGGSFSMRLDGVTHVRERVADPE